MPVLKKGCCCGELETCALVVGWLGIVFAILNIFGYFVAGYHWLDTIVYIIIGVCHLVISGLLIKATKDKKPSLVTPWLILVIVEIILYIIAQVVHLVQYPHENNNMLAGSVIGLLIGTGLSIYIWLNIYSYYQLLSNK